MDIESSNSNLMNLNNKAIQNINISSHHIRNIPIDFCGHQISDTICGKSLLLEIIPNIC